MTDFFKLTVSQSLNIPMTNFYTFQMNRVEISMAVRSRSVVTGDITSQESQQHSHPVARVTKIDVRTLTDAVISL